MCAGEFHIDIMIICARFICGAIMEKKNKTLRKRVLCAGPDQQQQRKKKLSQVGPAQ